MSKAPSTIAGQKATGQVNLSTGGVSPSAFGKSYARSLQSVLMMVFANTQMELDQHEMRAIRDTMDLALQLQSAGEAATADENPAP